MGLKEFRDNWETWGKGKKVVSIIAGCCILTFVFAMLLGMLTPDANNSFVGSDGGNSVDDDKPFEIEVDSVPVEESSISITSQDSESSSYAYFYSDGSYAEPAYTTYSAEDFNIVLNMKNLKISNTSEIDYSTPFDSEGRNVYNTSGLTKDITKLVKSDNVSVKLECYDKKNNFIRSYSDFDISMKKGILTLTHSDSDSSDYHTGKHADSDLSDIKYAKILISGTLSGNNVTRDMNFDLTSEKMNVIVNA